MRSIPTSRAGGAAALLALLALVLAGVGVPAAVPLDPGVAAFLAAGGTPHDLCGAGSAPGRGHGGDGHCDACGLIGPALLPDPSRLAAVRPRRGRLAAPAATRAMVPALRVTGAPRAPPSLA